MRLVIAAICATVLSGGASRAGSESASAEQLAQVDGTRLTCIGAERAGNAAGSIPAYSGKWSDTYPGYKGPGVYSPGPYTAEKPLFTITAQNAAQYAEHLTEGQKALLKRYPESFRMPVYPAHRDFAYPPAICAVVRQNAARAKVVHDGLGIDAVSGAIPFPFPKDGLEAQWNMTSPHRAWTEDTIQDQVVVYANGSKAWGRLQYRILSLRNDLRRPGSTQDPVYTYFFVRVLLPERQAGEVYVGWEPNDFSKEQRQTWFYNPGTRRVRQAPEIGFDTPAGPAGLRTADDDRLFNGSPERYDWKLQGKKEIYVPYNSFTQNDPALRYEQLLTPSTLNPEAMRYELHRVWLLEATLKPGYRHSYARRQFYLDEDSWHALWADNYDRRGLLWRASLVNHFWAPEIGGFHAGISVYHDLTANAYFADRLVNQSRQWWWLNQGGLTREMFTPGAAQRKGH